MKEMMRDWIQRKVLDLGSHYMLAGGDQLTDLGKMHFQKLTYKIKNGESTPLSEYIGVLYGFNLSVDGLDLLESLKGESVLFLENHTADGPIRNGNWKLFATSYAVKVKTGKEIRWTYGKDRSTIQEFLRKPLTESINAIPIRERDGTQGVRDIIEAFHNQDSIGLYPEGNSHKKLIRGDLRAGGIILHVAKKNIPIIATAAWFGENACHLSFVPIDNDVIKNIGKQSSDKNQSKQGIVDYAMRQIARNLPKDKRGFYSI